jgi:PAS domain S-box-containing protein
MEIALRGNEEMQRSLFEHAPDAIVVTDQNGLIFQVNAQAETIFGYSRKELLGQSVDLLVPERVRKFHAGHHADYHAAPPAHAQWAPQ